MPPLICLPPNIIDQGDVISRADLRNISIALGNLQQHIDNNQIELVFTEYLTDLISDINWQDSDSPDLLTEINRLISIWILKPSILLNSDLVEITNYSLHPIPVNTRQSDNTEYWQDEVGRLLIKHDASMDHTDNFFIGIMCELAFSGEAKGSYAKTNQNRFFPLVGPDDIFELDDAYKWDLQQYPLNKEIDLQMVIKNICTLGATRIIEPQKDSHYKFEFYMKRPWTLSRNVNPVPDRFLHQLIRITGYPIEVVKYSLIYGELPGKICKLANTKQ